MHRVQVMSNESEVTIDLAHTTRAKLVQGLGKALVWAFST
jgi:hypothetical protein